MENDETVVLALTVYGNAREGLPVHQAEGMARKAVESLGDNASALDAIAAFDEAYRQFKTG